MKRTGGFVCLFLSLLYANAQEIKEAAVTQSEGSTPGYVLFAPLNAKITCLIDKCGNLVHYWNSKYKPAQSTYLLPDGSLLRAGNDTLIKSFPSTGGVIERFDWDNKLIWTYSLANETERFHHDICPMANGNILAIAYRKIPKDKIIAAGRRPSDLEPYLLDEKILEIKPIGRDSARIVWEWDAWDHLVQDSIREAPNYGVIAQNPQLLNINHPGVPGPDWLHFNSVSYNAELDQIIISVHELSEIFVIDHSTTSAEAASHHGGKRGKGGDLLYRWGNPGNYHAGTDKDQKLFRQHNAHWIEKGMKDGGKIMVFNNGTGRPEGLYSTIDVIEPPMDKNGNYSMKPGKSALPIGSSWNYRANDPVCFFSKNISGAQRLANGNTLICAGHIGRFFEIDANKNIVWTYFVRAGIETIEGPGVKHTGQVFRCTFYEPSYEAFKNRNVVPCAATAMNPAHISCFSK